MPKGRKPRTAMAGEKFGRLTLTTDSYVIRKGNSASWASHCMVRCECGTVKQVLLSSLRSGKTTSCGCYMREVMRERSGPRSPAWRGGRIQTSQGYIKALTPGHPAVDDRGYVYEHRLVMEKKLGRYLLPGETVHHINNTRNDNRPENLQLRIGNHGKAAAYACSDCGSSRIHPVPLADPDNTHVATYEEA